MPAHVSTIDSAPTGTAAPHTAVLMVTAAETAPSLAACAAQELGITIDLATCRREALAAVRRRNYAVLLLDDSFPVTDSADLDQLMRTAATAYPLHINFALAGAARVTRELRAALDRRKLECRRAELAGAAALEERMRSPLTALMLQLDLLYASPGMAPENLARVRCAMEQARDMRARICQAPDQATNSLRAPRNRVSQIAAPVSAA